MPDKDVVFTGTWVALDVEYTVEHYQQNIDDDDYTLVEADTEHLTGKAGELTKATPKDYESFTVKPYEQAEISDDGSAVAKIYYDRETFTVIYDIPGAPESMNVPEPTKYRVGAHVTIEEILRRERR